MLPKYVYTVTIHGKQYPAVFTSFKGITAILGIVDDQTLSNHLQRNETYLNKGKGLIVQRCVVHGNLPRGKSFKDQRKQ